MLSALIVNLFKSIFGFLFNKEPELTENEKRIFNKELNVKNKNDMLERIDYWVDKSDYKEAKKLTDLYIEYNGIDNDIEKRKIFLNKF